MVYWGRYVDRSCWPSEKIVHVVDHLVQILRNSRVSTEGVLHESYIQQDNIVAKTSRTQKYVLGLQEQITNRGPQLRLKLTMPGFTRSQLFSEPHIMSLGQQKWEERDSTSMIEEIWKQLRSRMVRRSWLSILPTSGTIGEGTDTYRIIMDDWLKKFSLCLVMCWSIWPSKIASRMVEVETHIWLIRNKDIRRQKPSNAQFELQVELIYQLSDY